MNLLIYGISKLSSTLNYNYEGSKFDRYQMVKLVDKMEISYSIEEYINKHF